MGKEEEVEVKRGVGRGKEKMRVSSQAQMCRVQGRAAPDLRGHHTH